MYSIDVLYKKKIINDLKFCFTEPCGPIRPHPTQVHEFSDKTIGCDHNNYC